MLGSGYTFFVSGFVLRDVGNGRKHERVLGLHLLEELFHHQVITHGSADLPAEQQVLILDDTDVALVIVVEHKVADIVV